MKPFKILSLNTWGEGGPWKIRWKVILDNLKELSPGIVGFQEVFNPDWAQEVKKKAKYPYLVFHPERSGLMILSKFPVLQSACLTMKTQSPTEDYKRYVLFAEIDLGNKKTFAFFDTHLSWQLDEGPTRENQVGELLQFIEEKAGNKDRAVMGDFNAAPHTPEIRKMAEQGKFTDTFAALNPRDPGLTWSNDNPYARQCAHPLPDRRIDYIFVRREEGVLPEPQVSKIVMNWPNDSGVWPSDHFGVVTTFEKDEV
ncbi:MAG: endonuclease/exonuclease/phosphatase family protein [Candidatus Omnitrophica bacterium]|nr:endonuclease/exonuclease/phosphatase family protein [Candidatus Omnitrophota bacterium]